MITNLETIAVILAVALALVPLALRARQASSLWARGGAPVLLLVLPCGAGAALMGASILVPAGFFLGGTIIYGGDPGLGIFLLPLGAILLLLALVFTAVGSVMRRRDE